MIRHLGLLPSAIDHEFDHPLYEAVSIEFQDAPPVDLTVARYLGIKPYEAPVTDPDEARDELRRFLRV